MKKALFGAILMVSISASMPTVLVPTVAQAAVESGVTMKLPKPDVEILPNGLELVWFTSDKIPVVDLAMIVRSGSRDDLAGKSGTAQLMTVSLDRGSGGLSAKQIAQKVESLGATRYANLGPDSIRLGMHGLAPDAEVLLDLFSRHFRVRQPAVGEVVDDVDGLPQAYDLALG